MAGFVEAIFAAGPAVGSTVLEKARALETVIGRYGSAVVAFSGGVDSTFLARAARDIIGERVLLVTALSATYPAFEREEARQLAGFLGMPHRLITTDEMNSGDYRFNPPDRCYHCKRELFTEILKIAVDEGYDIVFEGGNADDLGDYRPGRRAVAELGAVSPLCEAGLTKQEIRAMSAALGLPTAAKPSYACLASRFPYGEELTTEKMTRVEKAEDSLRRLGFTRCRVRSHVDLARIELAGDEVERGWSLRREIDEVCRAAGFLYVTMDLRGYRTGAMNEALKHADRR